MPKSNPSELAQRLSGPLMEIDLMDEIRKLEQADSYLRSGHNAKQLAKHPDLRIALTVLKKGCSIQGHKAEARISIQALKGKLRLHVESEIKELPAGSLLILERGLRHDVEAPEDSAFLLTIAWPEGRQ